MRAMIHANDPHDWKDLEHKVAGILTTTGMRASRGVSVRTVRGPVVVDVVAHDATDNLDILYLVECKHWNVAVPKSVVHSFRTVVHDSGAHVGLLVSRRGFQSGAHAAARSSNVRLLDWSEFQLLFLERWKAGRYAQLKPMLEEVFEYYDYVSAPIGNSIAGNRARMAEWELLLRKHNCVAEANPWSRMVGETTWPPALPSEIIIPDEHGMEVKCIAHDYATLFDFVESRGAVALEDFRAFVAKYRTGPVGS